MIRRGLRFGAWGALLGFLSVLESLWGAGVVEAQSGGVEAGRPHPGLMMERRERIRMLRTWQMIVSLDMDEAQSQRFFLILKRHDDEEDRLNALREQLTRSLKSLVDRPTTPERALQDTMQAIRRQEDLLRDTKARFRSEAAGILTLRQQARMILFEQRFDMVLRNMIVDVMMNRRGEGGWGPPDRAGGQGQGGGWNLPPR